MGTRYARKWSREQFSGRWRFSSLLLQTSKQQRSAGPTSLEIPDPDPDSQRVLRVKEAAVTSF